MTHQRAAYLGALAFNAWQSVLPVRDMEMQLFADMFIRAFHEAPFVLKDAPCRSILDDNALRSLALAMRHAGKLRRVRAPKLTGPIGMTDEIELVPAFRAQLAGYFSGYFDRFRFPS